MAFHFGSATCCGFCLFGFASGTILLTMVSYKRPSDVIPVSFLSTRGCFLYAVCPTRPGVLSVWNCACTTSNDVLLVLSVVLGHDCLFPLFALPKKPRTARQRIFLLRKSLPLDLQPVYFSTTSALFLGDPRPVVFSSSFPPSSHLNDSAERTTRTLRIGRRKRVHMPNMLSAARVRSSTQHAKHATCRQG